MITTLALVLALSSPGAPRYADAKTVFEAGQQAFEAGEFAAAAAAYEQALALLPTPGPGQSDPRPAIVFSLAQAYRRHYFEELDTNKRSLDSLDRAVEAYRRYVVMDPTGSRRTDAEDHLATLELELARVALLGLRRKAADEERPTLIMITSKTAGAQASIDGTATATVPVVREVAPGKHTVRVEREGFFPEDVEAEAVKGNLAVVPVDLTPMPARLTVEAPSDALVSIDGRIIGVAPVRTPVELTAGRRLVTITASGRQSYSKEIHFARGVTESLRVDLEPTGQRLAARYFLIGGALVAGAGVITGGVALLNNASARVYLLRRESGEILTRPELDEYISARSSYVRFRALSLTSLIVAGVVLATGGLLYTFDAPSSGSATTMTPFTAPGTAGFAF